MTTKGEGNAYKWIVAHASHPDKDACLTWPFYRERHGRGIMGHNGRNYWAHRFMCTLVHGEPPTSEHQAGHDCGKGHEGCVNPHHIKWKTVSENALDRWRDNPHLRQAARGNVRLLTPSQANTIRSAKGARTQVELAAEFGVSENLIQNIWAGRTHARESKIKHYTPEDDDKMREALGTGLNFTQLAKLFPGRSVSGVMGHAYRIGLTSGQPVRKIYDPPKSDEPGSEQTNGERQ